MTKREKMIEEIKKINIGTIITVVHHIDLYQLSLRQIINAVIYWEDHFKQCSMISTAKKMTKVKNKLIKIYFYQR